MFMTRQSGPLLGGVGPEAVFRNNVVTGQKGVKLITSGNGSKVKQDGNLFNVV
jgi:hypothetical protein